MINAQIVWERSQDSAGSILKLSHQASPPRSSNPTKGIYQFRSKGLLLEKTWRRLFVFLAGLSKMIFWLNLLSSTAIANQGQSLCFSALKSIFYELRIHMVWNTRSPDLLIYSHFISPSSLLRATRLIGARWRRFTRPFLIHGDSWDFIGRMRRRRPRRTVRVRQIAVSRKDIGELGCWLQMSISPWTFPSCIWPGHHHAKFAVSPIL